MNTATDQIHKITNENIKMHPEIYNSNIPMDQKVFLQEQLEYLKGNFDKLLEDMEKYAVLPDVEDYENATHIRDYRKSLQK